MATKNVWEVHGKEGGTAKFQDVDGTMQLVIDGTAVTATAAELNEAADKSTAAVVAAVADVTLTQATHAGKIVTLGSATGDTATLPAATGTGDVYTIVIAVTATSNNHIIQVANATDEFVGVIYQVDADTGDALVAYPCLDADGFDTITMNGSTKGGIQGDKYVFIDIAAGKWQLEGHQSGTGTVATPLSAAVS